MRHVSRPDPVARPDAVLPVVAVAAVAALVVILATTGMFHGSPSSDTVLLVQGTHAALHCLSKGQLTTCGSAAVGPFPLLQYLPAALLIGMGAHSPINDLAWVSLVSFVACLGLVAAASRRIVGRSVWLPVLMAAMVSGPILYYATSGFGEMLAATCILAAVTAARSRNRALIVLAVFVACLGKETLPPFVAVLALVAGREAGDRLLPPRRTTVAVIGAALAGFVTNALFDVFRFGKPTNSLYLNPLFRTDNWHIRLSFFGMQFFAPAGGISWYWPLSLVLILGAAGWAVREARRDRRALRRWLPVAVVVACVAGYAAGLAAWFTPFGWTSWGPRLLIPIIPGALVALAHAGGAPMAHALVRRLRQMVVVIPLLVLVAAGTWPQAAAPWTAPVVPSVLEQPDAHCGHYGTIQADKAAFENCTSDIAWRLRPNILARSLHAQSSASMAASSVAVVGATAALLLAVSRARRRKPVPATARAEGQPVRAPRQAAAPVYSASAQTSRG